MKPARLIALPIALALASIALAQPGNVPTPLELGKTAPLAGVRMKNVNGRDTSIAQAAGKKGTLVLFICNHCPWVKMWETRIARIGNDALKRGIGVVAVNANDPTAYAEDSFEEMQARAKKLGYRFAYVVDGTSDVARAFGATCTPEAFLFDAQGKLVYHGTVDDNARDEKAVKQPWLTQAVQAVVGGKSVAKAETKALGCSIKMRPKTTG